MSPKNKPRAADGVELHWVDGGAPARLPVGTSFGVPWAQGEVDRTSPIAVTSNGTGIPVQTWPLAYWPDGSLKWTGHALAAETAVGETLQLSTDTPTEPTSPVSVNEGDSTVEVSTGSFKVVFNKSGSPLVQSLSLDGATKAQDGKLVVLVQSAPDELELPGDKPSVLGLEGSVSEVTVEQSGPVRAVIKVTGKYSGDGHDDFLPFTARFYVSAGSTAIRLVHFFVYDGDQTKDFIKGLGLRFAVPLSDELYDRHIRFASAEGGIWGEAVRGVSGLRRDATAAVLKPQFDGTKTPALSTWPATVTADLNTLPVWQDFTLDQLSPRDYTIKKRSNGGRASSFLDHAGFGSRAAGVGYIGGATAGGALFALKDFWQGAPRGLDIRDAGSDSATVTLWAYSPRGHAIDMRHYDTVSHGLNLAYEDVGDPDPNPEGIGRSYEATIEIVSATPSRGDISAFASYFAKVPQVVATPEFYASHKLFGGSWDLPNPSSSAAAADIEQRKSALLDFYVAEIEQRQFYGFWNFGDIMHTYDSTRHTWRYDVGGYAWDNGELSSDLWLWFSFLRTGRADVWRTAYNMTRHLSEVDFHHSGTFAGLGSRHNVSHWGDGAKEARVASAILKRPFYYLTADELIGDIMDYTLQADQSIVTWEPLRKILDPPKTAPGRVRLGPDWTTLAGNWFTKWERTNDETYLNKLRTSMRDIAGLPYGLFTGYASAVGWDPATAHITWEGDIPSASFHLTMIFGGGEFLMEAMEVITDEPDFDATWLDFCRLYNGTDAEKTTRYGISFKSGGFEYLYAKLDAYAGERLNDDKLRARAWTSLKSAVTGIWAPVTQVGGTDVLNPINEIVDLATNDAGQYSLAEYAVIAFVPGFAPASAKASTWDTATLQGSISEKGDVKKEVDQGDVKKDGKAVGKLRRWICMG
ncbi:hypothetical protein CYLTODRAFT_392656 [Cylindrobasidium torrendii FP15055 ss-10]|uniref:Tat pathway signal sequence domain protein n=1 Tax=Cylindrobasidium torrendii FP15055 ss-10 TaxID=1314674 RepID=A0A0D7BHS9_9AGAR|nr:hypothetical protein CYLTODRAFT_392656 [Cylindrobasidium torrendii FP15055 ss-10]